MPRITTEQGYARDNRTHTIQVIPREEGRTASFSWKFLVNGRVRSTEQVRKLLVGLLEAYEEARANEIDKALKRRKARV